MRAKEALGTITGVLNHTKFLSHLRHEKGATYCGSKTIQIGLGGGQRRNPGPSTEGGPWAHPLSHLEECIHWIVRMTIRRQGRGRRLGAIGGDRWRSVAIGAIGGVAHGTTGVQWAEGGGGPSSTTKPHRLMEPKASAPTASRVLIAGSGFWGLRLRGFKLGFPKPFTHCVRPYSPAGPFVLRARMNAAEKEYFSLRRIMTGHKHY